MTIAPATTSQQSAILPAPRFVAGLRGAARALYIARLVANYPCIVVVSKDARDAESMASDLTFFCKNAEVLNLPDWGVLPFEPLSPQPEIIASRMRALLALRLQSNVILSIAAPALIGRVIRPNYLKAALLRISTGDTIQREPFLQRLEQLGYRSVASVSECGEIAVRGAVIDLFSPLHPAPVRLEFFDTIVEEMREFSVETQRSSNSLTTVEIAPVREWQPIGDDVTSYERAHESLKIRGQQLEVPPREIARLSHVIRTDMAIPGREILEPLVRSAGACIWDHLPAGVLVAWNDEIATRQALDSAWEQVCDRQRRAAADHTLVPEASDLYVPPDLLWSEAKSFHQLSIDNALIPEASESAPITVHSETLVELAAVKTTKARGNKPFAPLAGLIKRWRAAEKSVALIVGSTVRAERLQKILLEYHIDATPLRISGQDWLGNRQRLPVVILEGHLSQGFSLDDPSVVIVAEHEIFAERSYRKGGTSQASLKRLMSSLAQLSAGDFVVHVDYGIGLYQGLIHLDVEGAQADFLHLEYAGGSKLYLPVAQIGKIQKFSAAEGQVPQLDRLGTNSWDKKKDRVKAAVASLAGDLIKLYATRSVAKGWRFEPFGAADEEFSESFPFDYTPDQWKAIAETVSDMANDKPMDRLVCGDAGFGKTEVAMMAAHKCVQHGRQVGVLVPTTILAQQHATSFIERFQGTSTRIASLSRFNTPQQNKETLAALAAGDLDVIIGTHRLLSRDIQFKDLGLLIIDEEHRFGVAQKEKLKQLKKQVDVLSLSATPIPRTLHMSLIGVRDISVITTPPTDRQAIRTYVAPYVDSMVRDAIFREVQRGGQCFFIHNRIESIGGVTDALRVLVPEARFEFAHGQMNEEQLEEIMLRFINRDFDVLVSTTIVESGVDIPNANTIIIDRADTFGLAQLYQLRGRAGRSNRQAYAYLLVSKTTKLGNDAQQRLKALQGLDELGLGFNLALRDMEIRGAGNLLGREQSGTVLEVGFELYSKILKEAILNLKGEELDFTESIEPEMKLGLSAFIPEEYVPDVSERLIMYQRLSSITNDHDAEDLRAELADRFGPLPSEVADYVELMLLRATLRRGAIVRAEFSAGKLLLSFSPKNRIDPLRAIELIRSQPKVYRLNKNDSFAIFLPYEKLHGPRQLIEPVERLLDLISKRD